MNLQSVDFQRFPNFVFCNTALKNEQRWRFFNKNRFCYKMLQEVTQICLCKSLIFFMLHLLQMLQGKSSHFLRKKFFSTKKLPDASQRQGSWQCSTTKCEMKVSSSRTADPVLGLSRSLFLFPPSRHPRACHDWPARS